MSEHFPKPKSLGVSVKVELALLGLKYATKADLKKATGVAVSDFSEKTDLANLKPDVDKLGIEKLKNVSRNLDNLKSKVEKLNVDQLGPVPVDLSKLSDVVKKDVFKTDAYNAKIKNTEEKIPDITNLATNTTLNVKINEVKTNYLVLLT